MNVRAASPVPGNSDAERFDNAVRKTFTVSKEEMERREAEWKRSHLKASVVPTLSKRQNRRRLAS
jgi:hypothetical protein